MKVYLDYPTFNQLCLAMAQQIEQWKPDQLVAVSRGGFSAAHIISKHMNLKCGVYMPHDGQMLLPSSYKPIKKLVFVEDLIAKGRTIETLKLFMNKPENSTYEWKIAPVLVDDAFDMSLWMDNILTYGISSPHWMIMPYEDFYAMKEGDHGLFRDGTDKYGKP